MINELFDEGAKEQYVRSFNRFETYIPFQPNDLCKLLVNDLVYQRVQDPVSNASSVLFEIKRRLTSAVKLIVVDRFDKWQDSYVFLDPDIDVLLNPSDMNDDDSIAERNESFQKRMLKALSDGSFEKLTRVDFEEASKTRSVLGLSVATPSKSEINSVMFARGRRIRTHQHRSWKTLWLTIEEHELRTYQRIFLVFYRTEDSAFVARPVHPFSCLLDVLPKAPDSLCKSVKPGKLYLKIFKDIEMSDIDMLIPGSKVEFTNLDYLLLFIPMLIGLISAIYKAVNGTLDFSTLTNTMTSALLVILPLTYAVRAYFGFRQKREAYNSNLTRMLSLHGLATNSGAVTSILDEVSDQETMDALLAYAFLWKGRTNPISTPRSRLHKEIEAFLHTQLRSHGVETMIRYDVKTACDKLMALKLIKKYEVFDGEPWIQAVSSDVALKELSAIDITKRQTSLNFGGLRSTTTEFDNLAIV